MLLLYCSCMCIYIFAVMCGPLVNRQEGKKVEALFGYEVLRVTVVLSPGKIFVGVPLLANRTDRRFGATWTSRC